MTIAANSNLGWEVAGGKKNAAKKFNEQANRAPQNNKDLLAKIPRIETLPPLRTENTIYDYIRESDDEDADIKNNNVKVKPKQQPSSNPVQANLTASTSPKPKKQQEPINLLQSSMIANQKKKAINTQNSPSGRNSLSEYENTLNNLRLDDFEKEQTYLLSLFPGNTLLINQHLATFLNNKLNHLAEFETAMYHEKELSYPLAKIDKRVYKFLSSQLAKLNKGEQEKLFEFCFGELFLDNPKVTAYHGFKIYLQLLTKQSPFLFINNLQKYQEIINENKHRHQKCLIALWALGQVGLANASSGIRVWFENMLPMVGTKNCTTFVALYLHNIFDLHKISNQNTLVQASNNKTNLLSFDQYTRFYDLVYDVKSSNLNLSKDVSNKLKSSFQILRGVFVEELTQNGANYIESLFQAINNEKTSKQAEFVELASFALVNNKDTLTKWRQIYSKYLSQTITMIEYLSDNYNKRLKSIKEMNKTLYYFEEQTTLHLNRLNASSSSSNITNNKEGNKQPHFRKAQKSTTSLELDMNRKLNSLAKVLIKQHFQRTSILGMVLRTLVILTALVGAFFYWDINQNKSTYTNSLSKELARYGLLDQTLQLIKTVKNLGNNIYNLVNHYVPIWYKKVSETVVPFSKQAFDVSREYLNTTWVQTEPYRKQAVLYFNDATKYVEQNYPVVVKNLISVVELTINYATTLYNFGVYYIQIALDFVGIQLLGWKRGEFEKIFLDAFKLALGYLTQLIQRLNDFLAQQ